MTRSFVTVSISTRLTLALLTLLLLFGGVTLGVTLVTNHLHGQQLQQELNRDLARQLVEEQLPLGRDGIRREALDSIFHQLMVINPDIEVYLLDPQGTILEYSAPPGRVRRDRVDLEPIETFLREGAHSENLPILGDDPRDPSRRKIFSVAPILDQNDEGSGGRHLGYLYVVLAGEQVESMTAMVEGSNIVRLGLWIVGASLLLALVTGGFLFRRLTRRLRSLAREMGSFQSELRSSGPGEATSEPFPAAPGADLATDLGSGGPRGDEIELLRASFRHLTERIDHQIELLRENDRLRRELVANVSHDLRTPITHLQGYLETLQLKEDVLAPEERREYLEIATQQAERLGRLVGDLFELAKLEARQSPLEIETFSMAELIQDVVQKFRIPAERADVQIDGDLATSPALVSADLDLVERVLDNLIDNALRHTPRGGTITVGVHACATALEPDGRPRITVEVRDTGPGIPAADLPHIFDRFYRGARRPGTRDAGTGLGLAIARRALELHGTDLTCESVPGEGATFRFEL